MQAQSKSIHQAVVGSGILLLGMALSMALILSGPLVLPMDRDAVASQQCLAADAAAIRGLAPVIHRLDQRSTTVALTAFQAVAWAREDCKTGRWDRAFERYARVERSLASLAY